MKALVPAAALMLIATVVGIRAANADPRPRGSEKILVQDSEERYVRVVGSHIPQKVHLRSIGTDTPYNVRVYTQRELQSTGRPTLAEALALDPAVQISSRGR